MAKTKQEMLVEIRNKVSELVKDTPFHALVYEKDIKFHDMVMRLR